MEASQRVKVRWKEKKVAPSRTQFPLAQEEKPHTTRPCDACTMQPFSLLVLNCFSPFYTVWTLWSCIYYEFKDTFEEKELKRVFQSHFALFPCLFTLGLYKGGSMNELVFFLVALAEVQVAVLTVLNLPQQGFLATRRIVGSISAVSRVRSLILPGGWVWAHFPEQRLVIEPSRIGHCCVLQPAVICLTDTLRFAKAIRQHTVTSCVA